MKLPITIALTPKGIVIIIGIFSKWRKIEVVKWAEDAIYAPIQTTDDKNRSLR